MAGAFREELIDNVPWNSRKKMTHEMFMQSLYYDRKKNHNNAFQRKESRSEFVKAKRAKREKRLERDEFNNYALAEKMKQFRVSDKILF